MNTRVLAAGDHFVPTALLAEAIRAEVGDGVEVRPLTLPWPVEPLAAVGEVNEASGTEEMMIDALRDVEICVTQMAPLTERVLAASPALRLFGISRSGPDNANVAAATGHGVAVCAAPKRNATTAAEHTVGLLLAAVRRIPQAHGELAEGVWRRDYYRYDRVGPAIDGGTVGVVGCGAIGSKVARIVQALGARVLVFDPYLDDDAVPTGVTRVDTLDELLAGSGVLTLHPRLTPETRGMIGPAELAALPDGAVVVNTARAGLLDYEALCDALDSGHLYGAGLDVFPVEPVPTDSRLLRTRHVVLSPHRSSAGRDTVRRAARTVARDAGRYLRGEPLAHCTNPEALTMVRRGRVGPRV